MIAARSRLAFIAATALGCGGAVRDDGISTSLDAGADAAAATEGARDAALDAGPCRTADGVRLCGGSCGALTREQCPGVGCQPLVDRVTGQALGMGVCVADLPVPLEQCGRCRDGAVCVHVAGEGPVCVPEAFCRQLHSLGLTRACRYADFSVYDGQELAVARGDGCPAYACGPGCGACPLAPIDRCSGRSARFGYGFCFHEFNRPRCNPTEPLPRACNGMACIAWTPTDPNDTLALSYGLCDDPFKECSAGDGRLACRTP